MSAPGSKTGRFHNYPVALGEGGDTGAERYDFETAFVAGDGGGDRGSEEGGEGGPGGVDALDLVYVCGVYGGCEGAEENGFGGERGGDGMVVQTRRRFVVVSWLCLFIFIFIFISKFNNSINEKREIN